MKTGAKVPAAEERRQKPAEDVNEWCVNEFYARFKKQSGLKAVLNSMLLSQRPDKAYEFPVRIALRFLEPLCRLKSVMIRGGDDVPLRDALAVRFAGEPAAADIVGISEISAAKFLSIVGALLSSERDQDTFRSVKQNVECATFVEEMRQPSLSSQIGAIKSLKKGLQLDELCKPGCAKLG